MKKSVFVALLMPRLKTIRVISGKKKAIKNTIHEKLLKIRKIVIKFA